MKTKSVREKEIENNAKANSLWVKRKTVIKEQELEHPWKRGPQHGKRT